MKIFKDINVNLYKMHFKNILNLKNQYEYLKRMYKWWLEKMENFEKGHFNLYNTSYGWMNNGIPDTVFSLSYKI